MDYSEISNSIRRYCQENNVDGLRNLIDSRLMSVNEKNTYIYTPLHYAAKYNSVECVEFLIEKGALLIRNIYEESPLHLACEGRSSICLKLLIQHFGTEYINLKNKNGETALDKAARSGSKECVQILIDSGADIHSIDTLFNWNSLFYAVKADSKDCLKLLLDAGGIKNIYEKDRYGNTLLHVAATNFASTELLKFIIDICGNSIINTRNCYNKTFLDCITSDKKKEEMENYIREAVMMEIKEPAF